MLYGVSATDGASFTRAAAIVLGGVAIVLMAAGGAGFLARRTRTRRAQLASAASVPHGSGPEPSEQP